MKIDNYICTVVKADIVFNLHLVSDYPLVQYSTSKITSQYDAVKLNPKEGGGGGGGGAEL